LIKEITNVLNAHAEVNDPLAAITSKLQGKITECTAPSKVNT
jgi:hypothetical protein